MKSLVKLASKLALLSTVNVKVYLAPKGPRLLANLRAGRYLYMQLSAVLLCSTESELAWLVLSKVPDIVANFAPQQASKLAVFES